MTRIIPKLNYGQDDGYPERLLLPMEICIWNEVVMPIEDRGISGEWIFNLVHEVQYQEKQGNRAVLSPRKSQYSF
jgi:hypothetical protein